MSKQSFIACSKCLAEISTDREACPHCGTALPEPSDLVKLREENERLKANEAAEIVRLTAENKRLTDKQNAKAN